MITDFYGKEYNDDLSEFTQKFLGKNMSEWKCFVSDGQHCVEGVNGLTIFREWQYQVQMFLVEPNVVIPEHAHPNVDSYEIFLRGMRFTLDGRTAVTLKRAERAHAGGMPLYQGEILRVYPGMVHGAASSPEGGAFLSIQKWLNDKKPTTVGDDWKGDTMGNIHTDRLKRGL